RKAFFGQSPKISKFGLIDHVGGHNDHRGLEFIDRCCERFAIRYTRFYAQVRSPHLPLLAQYSQDRESGLAQTCLLVTSRHTPKCIEVWNHARSEEHGSSAGQLAVVDAPASQHLIV